MELSTRPNVVHFSVLQKSYPSWLSSLKYIDIVCGSMIDYMHTVLLGVCRGLLYLWFDGQHRSEPWYRGGLQQAVDGRLTRIKPPSCITRTP